MSTTIRTDGHHYVVAVDGRDVIRTKSKDEALRLVAISQIRGWDDVSLGEMFPGRRPVWRKEVRR